MKTIAPSSAVIACPQCSDRMRLYGVEPHARLARTEVYTYVCDVCDQTEVVVMPFPKQPNEAAPVLATPQ